MGWPEQTATLKRFYPTTDLVTGPDIIFFWVARMIMAGYEYMGELPFHNVYFTGIIRDKQGRKMSKSLGNSPDPLELIDSYGADGLRFGIMRSAPQGQDVMFDEQNVELGRNFCTKLWNACRFRQMQGGGIQNEIQPDLLSSEDRWILSKLDSAIRELDTAFAEYKFNEATAILYRFFWSEYCDWYIESSKAVFFGSGPADESVPSNESTLTPENDVLIKKTLQADSLGDSQLRTNKLAVIDFVLSHTLRLFHPFLPFITEELWHGLGYASDMPPNQGGTTLLYAPWPKPLSSDEQAMFGLDETAVLVAQTKFDLATLGRNLKSQVNIPSNKRVAFVLKPAGNLDPMEAEVLKTLLNAESLVLQPEYVPPKGTPVAMNALGELYLPLAGLIDIDAERTRLQRELEKIESEIVKVETKLANPNFVDKVPQKVLDEHKLRLVDWRAKAKHVQQSLSNLPSSEDNSTID
jgi:valyl-tRNA synthetase